MITEYKKYLIVMAIATLLLFSFNWYVAKKESSAYDRGFQSANVQWERKGQEYVDLIDAGLEKNKRLNDKLAVLSEEKRKLEEDKTNTVKSQQIEYKTSQDALKKCLDDKFVDLYNNSLGD